ncbi:hypothetical protein LY625_03725 [Lysobacter sp. GX 14042]|uniref:hypothetical protein n=1 Tax=Lysobacter sp. GX 14042 TaxID=2907155 RepID=UPI001F28E14F|nr:hypothetical protein [Lysobacter sp. GX 14042]MCE7031733.1 hypothetical protein [Lysobacter sp. GX 14042]
MATLQELENGLRKAHAAGNADHARVFAAEIRRMRDQGQTAADFSGVTGSTDSTAMPRTDAQPSLFRGDSDFHQRAGLNPLQMSWAAARDMFGTRQGAAEYLAEQSGGRVRRDDRGEPVVELPDGTAYRLNDPGIDVQDVSSLAANIGVAALPAGWIARIGQARNVGLAGRAAMQGAGAGATDAALQAGFNDGRINPARTAAAVAGGAGGEALGTGLAAATNAFGRIGRVASGSNAARAQQLADEAGINATPEQLGRLSAAMEEVRAGADPRAVLGWEEFGFLYTQGQRMADPARQFQQLSREEVLRQSPGGGPAFQRAAAHNAERLDDAVTTMGERFGAQAATTPAEMVSGAGARLRGQADELQQRIGEAYGRAGEGARAAVSRDAVLELPLRLTRALAEFSPNSSTTPATATTLQQLRTATESILSDPNAKGVTLRALETQRRIINNNINTAASRGDRAALTTLKREFDGWMDEAVESALVNGDPAALAALKEARGLRAEFGRRFEGRGDADRFIAGLLDGSRTPEELVNIALGASQVSKSGGARFIERLRVAANNDPQVMDGLRAAHFTRLTRGNNGDPLQPGQILRNIRTTEYNNASVLRALYSPDEWRQVQRLADALEPMVAKGDFGKSSGSTERFMRARFQQGLGFLPFAGRLVNSLIEGFSSTAQNVQAARAIHRPVRPVLETPATAPAGGGVGLQEVLTDD